ncbi:lysylphosphatidylglycerol synthase domain-containing protein [[Mycoplasma] mobile]|uniref:Phosphoglucomutase/phosphomannomutase n=1 Tax=Mycoplasma mobile (strain ATCC 43663 / 163K / NCTC 11711) TaxID=267748 RepID=Q6KI88_MYCM1|nr:lysylphosphatidylglycerol synthase domain-containing protein [[Mycoplasma] mobile]AAT27688.1 phosphoglucomutase/phosphomannomutase [Mycoplasma mobile 163K]
MEFKNIYNKWNSFKTKDPIFKKSLLKISDQKLFSEAFSSSLKIHNSRIVAKMGANTNHLNEFTITAIAESYANFIKQLPNFQNKGIIINYDNRINSELYAKTFAHVLNSNGVSAFFFNNKSSTPIEFLPFTIKKYQLEGGVNVSSSKNYKGINGLLFYKQDAFLLTSEDEEKIQENLKSTIYLSNPEEVQEYKIKYLDFEIENEIVNFYKSHYKSNLEKKIRIQFSSLYGTSEIFSKILGQIGFDVNFVKSESENAKKVNPWQNLKRKSYSSSNPKSLNRAILKARLTNRNFCVAINPDGSKFSIAIKHKKRFKYLKSSELAAIYLKYVLEDRKIKDLNFKNLNIVKSFGTSSLINKIARKHDINVIETFHDLKIDEKTKVLLALDEDFGFYDYKSNSNFKDAFSIIITLVEAANFYLNTQSKDFFEILQEIEKEYNVHRISSKKSIISNNKAKRFFTRLENATYLGKKKIVNKYSYIENISNGQKQILILKLIDFSTITVEYSSGDKILKLFVEVIGKKEELLMDVVINERQIYNDIKEFNEVDESKKIGKKDIFRYSIFISIFILIFVFLFQTIYSLNGNPSEIFNQISNILLPNKANLYFYVALVLFSVLDISIRSFSLKRMLLILGQKVKFKDLFIGAYLGIALTNITPLPGGGGDVITYWYLRRRGVERSSLYASILMGSILYSSTVVIMTVIFLPIGITFYAKVFENPDPATITLIIFLSIGTLFDIFSASMITLISVNKKLQEWIVRTSIKFLEWIPFVTISDPGSVASKFQYEFSEIRKGIKMLTRKKRYLFEQLGFYFIPWFISSGSTLGATIFQNSGRIIPNLPAGTYFNLLSGSSLLRAANSVSITPGGTGTIDLFTTRIFEFIFIPTNNSISNSAVFSLMDRLINLITPTILSFLLIITIYFGERRVDKWNKKNHNNFLKGKLVIAKRTRFYKIATLIWILGIVSILIIIGFI